MRVLALLILLAVVVSLVNAKAENIQSQQNVIYNLTKIEEEINQIKTLLKDIELKLENVLTKSDFSRNISDFKNRELPQILEKELNKLKNNLTSNIPNEITMREQINNLKNEISGLLSLNMILISIAVVLSAANIVLLLKLRRKGTYYGEICA